MTKLIQISDKEEKEEVQTDTVEDKGAGNSGSEEGDEGEEGEVYPLGITEYVPADPDHSCQVTYHKSGNFVQFPHYLWQVKKKSLGIIYINA
jgi:hypothetical protein